MKKTIRTIKNKDIPKATKKKALAEIKVIADKLAKKTNFWDHEDLGCAFIWAETPSGKHFWSNIAEADNLKKVR